MPEVGVGRWAQAYVDNASILKADPLLKCVSMANVFWSFQRSIINNLQNKNKQKIILSIYLSSFFICRDSFERKFVDGITTKQIAVEHLCWDQSIKWASKQLGVNVLWQFQWRGVAGIVCCVGHSSARLFFQSSICLDWYTGDFKGPDIGPAGQFWTH